MSDRFLQRSSQSRNKMHPQEALSLTLLLYNKDGSIIYLVHSRAYLGNMRTAMSKDAIQLIALSGLD
jgi:hypothetical protein